MCVQERIKLGGRGQQYEAMKAGVGVPVRTSVPMCNFGLIGQPIQEKKGCM